MDCTRNFKHATGEFLHIDLDISIVTSLWLLPTVVKDHVIIANISKTRVEKFL